MTTSIKMPLRTFSPSVVQELQSKYPDPVVHIEVDALEEPVMDEAAFWNIISLLDWVRRRNEDVLAPAVAALSRYSETAIYQFEDILAEKLYALDGEKYAIALGWNGVSKDYFSPDIFYMPDAVWWPTVQSFMKKYGRTRLRCPRIALLKPCCIWLKRRTGYKRVMTTTTIFLQRATKHSVMRRPGRTRTHCMDKPHEAAY